MGQDQLWKRGKLTSPPFGLWPGGPLAREGLWPGGKREAGRDFQSVEPHGQSPWHPTSRPSGATSPVH